MTILPSSWKLSRYEPVRSVQVQLVQVSDFQNTWLSAMSYQTRFPSDCHTTSEVPSVMHHPPGEELYDFCVDQWASAALLHVAAEAGEAATSVPAPVATATISPAIHRRALPGLVLPPGSTGAALGRPPRRPVR